MSNESAYLHTNLDELVKVKIPALSRRGAENNKAVLKSVAMNGPSLKYDVCKSLELPISHYGTISRRIDALKKTGYLAETGKRPTERGKQTEQSLYGLTWRGFIASLAIREVRKNIFQGLEKNPLLTIPEKELVLSVLEDIFDPEETETIATLLFRDFLTGVSSLESVREEELKFRLFFLMLKENSLIFEQAIRKEGLLKLLDNPTIFRYVKKIVPSMKANLETQIRNLSISVRILDELDFIRPDEKPSEKLKEFFDAMRTQKS